MSKMNSPFKYMYDAAPEAALMARGDAAKTASFNGTALVLDVLSGHWNPAPAAPADQTLAAIINVTGLAVSARTGTITFASVVATDAFTISDGVSSVTFTAVANGAVAHQFNVGGTDALTAAAAAAAINAAHTAGDIAVTATSAGAVITVTNLLGTGGTITDADTTISETAFAGGNETYLIELETGPIGFGTAVTLGSLAITKTGQYVILLDLDTVKAVKADAAAIRIKGTLAGVAPSLTAYSWIAGVQH